ncbi:MAG: DUF547 domain-containing protein [Phaeodactylibacter sp.]|nr:DUF547 domain-containing protein [Phaeodactylibacter sp.]
MIRSFLFALSLLAFISCQSEKPKEKAEPNPPAQLTALEEVVDKHSTTAENNAPKVSAEDTVHVFPQERATLLSEAAPVVNAEKTTPKEAISAPKIKTKATEIPQKDTKPSKLATNTPETNSPAAPSHKTWDALLQQYVSSAGKVNYKGLLNEKARLQAYLDELAANPVNKGWSRNEKLAYWINAYNAFTVKLILDNYPVSSITDIHDGKPWDMKWIKLGAQTYSLNNIENDIIRPQFKEPRIHFAVNCAAVSCPPLLNHAWEADNINRYLEQQARSFINNPRYNTIRANAVEISKIFEWYASDFGNIIDYLNHYSETQIGREAKVSYRKYDWELNE